MLSATQSQRDLFKAVANPVKTDFQQQPQREQRRSASFYEPRGDGLHGTPFRRSDPKRKGSPPAFFSEALKGGDGRRRRGGSRGSRGSSRSSSRGGSSGSSSGSSGGGSSRESEEGSELGEIFGGLSSEREEEKKHFLHELRRMQLTHPRLRLTKEFSMQDSHEDIEYEFKRVSMAVETADNVNFLKDMLKLALGGVELANSKFKLLALDGWSDAATADMERYNGPLERCYRRVWRKGGSVNPFLELGFALVSSMMMYHFKAKLGFGGGGGGRSGGGRGAAAPATVPFNLGAFTSGGGGAGRSPAPPQDHNVPAGTMKPPQGGGGMSAPPPPPTPMAGVGSGLGGGLLPGLGAAGALLGALGGGGGGGGVPNLMMGSGPAPAVAMTPPAAPRPPVRPPAPAPAPAPKPSSAAAPAPAANILERKAPPPPLPKPLEELPPPEPAATRVVTRSAARGKATGRGGRGARGARGGRGGRGGRGARAAAAAIEVSVDRDESSGDERVSGDESSASGA